MNIDRKKAIYFVYKLSTIEITSCNRPIRIIFFNNRRIIEMTSLKYGIRNIVVFDQHLLYISWVRCL
jgi:hypothetical protein